jgi:hypothetical protein
MPTLASTQNETEMNGSPKKAKSKRMRSQAKPEAAKVRSQASEEKFAASQGVAGDKKRAALAKRKTPASGPAPKLLSGGNPQIAKGDGDAPVQAYIAAMPGWKHEVGRRLHAVITRTVPKVRNAVRWNSPFYGIAKRGWFLSFHCFTNYVKVTFLRGTSLRPPPPVASKHPNVRYFHIYEEDELDERLLAKWIKQASERPGDPLF